MITDEERARRLAAAVRAEDDQPEQWWFLSFADDTRPRGFLGACLIRARGPTTALKQTHALGCNPGGAVELSVWPELEERPEMEKWANRLLTWAECDTFWGKNN